MASYSIRRAEVRDISELAVMLEALWPEGSLAEHTQELNDLFEGKLPKTLLLHHLVAEDEAGRLIGFVEAGLRSVADGCDPMQSVGYIEGWYVDERHRKQGIGGALIQAMENWARSIGCKEMASDSEDHNKISLQAHTALGYEIVSRTVNYRKKL